MELLELKDNVLEIFQTDIEHLGDALMTAVNDNRTDLYDKFCDLIENDLTIDWMQKIYQYYHADRKGKKQDYTPKCLAEFMGRLLGDADVVVDMCAGSGALIIQRWVQHPDQKFRAFEIDENVIPFLLFNMAVRNIDSSVCQSDVLSNEQFAIWRITKGERYGNITYFKPAV